MKTSPEPVKRVGLVANTTKPSVRALLRDAVRILIEARCEILADPPTAALAGLAEDAMLPPDRLARSVDLLLVFGGDGTMLRAVREANGARSPILGVNIGRLGFLAAVPSRELAPALATVLAGHYSIDARPLILAEGAANGAPVSIHALNDVVISRGAASRMIEMDVHVDGHFLTRYRCDGLIISSPTGSTAYSLSAGGAIISPAAKVFALTPICPHTLSNRSVIVDMASRIDVRVAGENIEASFNADGQVGAGLVSGDVISVRRARREVRLARLDGATFFETVRHKLHWSGSNV